LQTTWIERSTVSSRVALLLRSAEVKLLFNRFVQLRLDLFSFFCYSFTSGVAEYCSHLGLPSLPWVCFLRPLSLDFPSRLSRSAVILVVLLPLVHWWGWFNLHFLLLRFHFRGSWYFSNPKSCTSIALLPTSPSDYFFLASSVFVRNAIVPTARILFRLFPRFGSTVARKLTSWHPLFPSTHNLLWPSTQPLSTTSIFSHIVISTFIYTV
jgi:hypothetical protein